MQIGGRSWSFPRDDQLFPLLPDFLEKTLHGPHDRLHHLLGAHSEPIIIITPVILLVSTTTRLSNLGEMHHHPRQSHTQYDLSRHVCQYSHPSLRFSSLESCTVFHAVCLLDAANYMLSTMSFHVCLVDGLARASFNLMALSIEC